MEILFCVWMDIDMCNVYKYTVETWIQPEMNSDLLAACIQISLRTTLKYLNQKKWKLFGLICRDK